MAAPTNPLMAGWKNPTITEWLTWRPESGTPAPMQYEDVRKALQKTQGGQSPLGSQDRGLFLDFLRYQGTAKYPTDPFATDEQLRLSRMNNNTRANLLANEKNPQWFKDYWSKKTDSDFAASQANVAHFTGGPVGPSTTSSPSAASGSQILQRNPDGSVIYKGANPYSGIG